MKPIEFVDGDTLDLEQVAADTNLPPWLATAADDLVHTLGEVRDAVEAARALDRHRSMLLGLAAGSAPVAAAGDQLACSHRGCRQVFATPAALRRHLGEAHRAPAEPGAGYRCDGCGREFSRPNGLGRHRPHCRYAAPAAPAVAAPAETVARAASVAPAAGVCGCGHGRRMHEPDDGMCRVGSCDCIGYTA